MSIELAESMSETGLAGGRPSEDWAVLGVELSQRQGPAGCSRTAMSGDPLAEASVWVAVEQAPVVMMMEIGTERIADGFAVQPA